MTFPQASTANACEAVYWRAVCGESRKHGSGRGRWKRTVQSCTAPRWRPTLPTRGNGRHAMPSLVESYIVALLLWPSSLCGEEPPPSPRRRPLRHALAPRSAPDLVEPSSRSLTPSGGSTMLDRLFQHPCPLARQREGPLLEERLRYLDHLAAQGMARATFRGRRLAPQRG